MTSQLLETLIIDGETHPLMTEPLRELLAAHGLPAVTNQWLSTMLFRGYECTWEIADGRLSLLSIEDHARDHQPYETVHALLQAGGGRLFADWYSGTLKVGQGKQLGNFDMGLSRVFERELHIDVAQGVVVRQAVKERSLSRPQRLSFWRRVFGGLKMR